MTHGFSRGLARGKTFFAHDALDVFHHHDGIIHQQANCQHHGKHRQGVNAVPERVKHRKGTQQHHGDGNSGDQRGAEVLQEQIHDQEHQGNRFQQGLYHILNRGFYEGSGFIGDFILQPVREILRQLIQTVQHQFRRRHFIRAGGQLNSKARGRVAVKSAQVVVFLSTHFHRRHIAQTHF